MDHDAIALHKEGLSEDILMLMGFCTLQVKSSRQSSDYYHAFHTVFVAIVML
jgi:hypothetical protein